LLKRKSGIQPEIRKINSGNSPKQVKFYRKRKQNGDNDSEETEHDSEDHTLCEMNSALEEREILMIKLRK